MTEIVPLTAELVPEVAALDRIIFPESPWGEEAFRDHLKNAYDYPLAAVREKTVIGYGIFRQLDAGEILLVGVDPRFRREGVGRMLVEEMLSCAEGPEGVFLEVREGNTAARNLYGSLGFCEIARRKNYYRDPAEDAVIMKLSPSQR